MTDQAARTVPAPAVPSRAACWLSASAGRKLGVAGCATVLAGWLMMVGCNGMPAWRGMQPGPASAPANTPPSASGGSTDSGDSTSGSTRVALQPSFLVTHITFDVVRVRVPNGLLSSSGKIWNHLDTEFLPAETLKLLHQNGIKPARGMQESWPPIKAILETERRVESSQNNLTVSNGLPLLLELDRPKDQILFVYRRDGTLAGAPWKTSTNLLRVEYGMSPRRADGMLFEVMPELRPDSDAAHEPRGIERWNPAPPGDRSLVLRDLAFRVELAPGQFIAIGPSPVIRELPFVVGSLMLSEEREGEKFESMYFLTPTVTRTGG